MCAAPVRDNLLPNIAIPADSTFRKAATLLPAIGFVIGFFSEKSLANQILHENTKGTVFKGVRVIDKANKIKLFEVQSDYKKVSIARSLFTAAALITVVALGILTGPVGYACLGAAGICILASVVYAKKLHTYTQTLVQMRE